MFKVSQSRYIGQEIVERVRIEFIMNASISLALIALLTIANGK